MTSTLPFRVLGRGRHALCVTHCGYWLTSVLATMGTLKVMALRALRTGARIDKIEGVTNGLQMRV
jgi:hypothetical protein